jgi:hypothetical protein
MKQLGLQKLAICCAGRLASIRPHATPNFPTKIANHVLKNNFINISQNQGLSKYLNLI